MANKKRLRLVPLNGFTFIDLGEMEIWDGADLALLRDSLTQLIRTEKHRAVGVDMNYVKYIPSGFFGMLFDYFEEGVRIQLRSPQPNVQRMLWFSKFFQPVCETCFELRPDTNARALPVMQNPLAKTAMWQNHPRVTAIASITSNK